MNYFVIYIVSLSFCRHNMFRLRIVYEVQYHVWNCLMIKVCFYDTSLKDVKVDDVTQTFSITPFCVNSNLDQRPAFNYIQVQVLMLKWKNRKENDEVYRFLKFIICKLLCFYKFWFKVRLLSCNWRCMLENLNVWMAYKMPNKVNH